MTTTCFGKPFARASETTVSEQIEVFPLQPLERRVAKSLGIASPVRFGSWRLLRFLAQFIAGIWHPRLRMTIVLVKVTVVKPVIRRPPGLAGRLLADMGPDAVYLRVQVIQVIEHGRFNGLWPLRG